MIFTCQSSGYWGGGAGGRILDKKRDREGEREREIMHQYIVYTCICLLVDWEAVVWMILLPS